MSTAPQESEEADSAGVRATSPGPTTWLRAGLVFATVAISVASGASLAIGYWQAQRASNFLVWGQGDAYLEAAQDALRVAGAPASAATVRQILSRHAADGVSYVAVVDPQRRVVIEAGTPTVPLDWSARLPGHPQRVGDRVRVGRPLDAVHPPEFGRHPGTPPEVPPPGGPPNDEPFGFAPGGPSPGGPPHHGPESGPGREPPPDHGPYLIMEFEPRFANQIGQGARATLFFGLLLLIVLMAGAAAVVQLLRHREELLRRLENERRLSALGEMSAVLAHEIRNPLASLKGHAQLLGETLPDGTREKAKARRVVDEAVRLESLTNDLLAFVRSGNLTRRETDPARLLRDAAEGVGDGRIRLDTTGAPPLWAMDGDRIQQVLTNVLVNAVQASAPEAPIEATVCREPTGLAFVVRDHGPGVREPELQRIFEPFHTSKTRGTGLGLAISRRIVTAHGGSISAANHPDGGAVFRIVLPEV